ncbi:MAG: hypothetical protein E6G57_03485 [Actinobacteria bacterium]|nr:MAG: hypothetical protein E6G57_03485 [Actinomycetota bacterium]
MKYYDLYGTRVMSAGNLAGAVASVLGISFNARDSQFVGPYFHAASGDEILDIELNDFPDRDEDELLEPDFADYQVLLRVSRTERADEIRNRLGEIPGLDHLRRKTLE